MLDHAGARVEHRVGGELELGLVSDAALRVGLLELVHRMLGVLGLERLVELPEAERRLVRRAAVTERDAGA